MHAKEIDCGARFSPGRRPAFLIDFRGEAAQAAFEHKALNQGRPPIISGTGEGCDFTGTLCPGSSDAIWPAPGDPAPSVAAAAPLAVGIVMVDHQTPSGFLDDRAAVTRSVG
jgi:hypothetical protein